MSVVKSQRCSYLGLGSGGGFKGHEKSRTQLRRLEAGKVPEEDVDPTVATFPVIIGADGVMVPFRPHSATSRGRTV